MEDSQLTMEKIMEQYQVVFAMEGEQGSFHLRHVTEKLEVFDDMYTIMALITSSTAMSSREIANTRSRGRQVNSAFPHVVRSVARRASSKLELRD